MKTILIFTLLLISTVFPQNLNPTKRTIYIDQSTTTPDDTQDGSQVAPYSSLEDAFDDFDDNEGGDIVFQGESYIIDDIIIFDTDRRGDISLNFIVPESFVFQFVDNGQIKCINYKQSIIDKSVRNVNLTIQDAVIVGQSEATLFTGDCNFTLQNVEIKGLTSSLFVVGSEGNILMDTVTISDINLPNDVNLIDHNSRARLEGDYLILRSVNIKNLIPDSVGAASTGIRSWLQWKRIDVRDSVFEGIGFQIAGEQIGGNLKTDITIFNVKMQNAKTFLYIESYGTLSIKDCSFENATSRAIHFSLTDENLSPNQILIHNCRFIGNSAPIGGGAIAFQGTSQTNYQFALNVLVQNSAFHNNKVAASGGAIAFLSMIQGNATIADSDFEANAAEVGGGCVHVEKASALMTMVMKNTRCAKNSAFQGGVFNIELTRDLPLTLENNLWEDNVAVYEGPIGYLSDSTVNLREIGVDYSYMEGAWGKEGQSEVNRV